MEKTGLVPELYCTDIKESLDFYINTLGFSIVYQREEDKFAYLKKENAELMLEQIELNSSWQTGELVYPFGRGVNSQTETESVDSL